MKRLIIFSIEGLSDDEMERGILRITHAGYALLALILSLPRSVVETVMHGKRSNQKVSMLLSACSLYVYCL